MSNILKQLTADDLLLASDKIMKAIYSFRRLNIEEKDIIISIPKYINEFIFHNYRMPVYCCDFENYFNSIPQRFANCKTQPSPDNKITVFHIDSPLYEHLAPVIIELNNMQ